MIPKILNLVRSKDSAFVRGRLDAVKLHNGTGNRNPKVSFIIFHNSHPILFLKTVRFSRHNFVIKRAFDCLCYASETVSKTNITIPKPLWVTELDTYALCAESVLEGRPLNSSVLNEVENIFQWLNVCAEEIKPSGRYSNENIRDSYKEILKQMRATDEEFINFSDNLLEKILGEIGVFEIPRILAHGDLTPANILVSDSGAGVIDWDRYGDIDMPFFDHFTFLERTKPKNQTLFQFGNTYIEQYRKKIGIERKVLPMLFFFYILLSDWRKREFMFPWEAPERDKKVLQILRSVSFETFL